MNYKSKYIKYKLKYLNIKNKIFGGVLNLNNVYNYNKLKTPGHNLEKVINDIKSSPVILLVGHGTVIPKLEGEQEEDLDLKNNTAIMLDTFRCIDYNDVLIDDLNKYISEQIPNSNINTIIPVIKQKFNVFSKYYGSMIDIKKIPVKQFNLNLTGEPSKQLGIYYYKDKEINLLEYTQHQTEKPNIYKSGENLEDIIERFSTNESKLFIVYSCLEIKDSNYLIDSPERLRQQPIDGFSGSNDPEEFSLTNSVINEEDYDIRVLPFSEPEEELITETLKKVDKKSTKKKLKKNFDEKCENCNNNLCSIQ